jgi:hypothetical protein
MVLKYVATALTVTMVAVVAALGVTVAEPQRAEAAVGVQVAACGGGNVELSAEEDAGLAQQDPRRTRPTEILRAS